MVTGTRAFDGKSQLSVASAILEKEPAPINTIKPMAPPALDHVIRKCLAKTADDRWQSAADIKHEIAWISQTSGEGSAIFAGPPKKEAWCASLLLRSRFRCWLQWACLPVTSALAVEFPAQLSARP
jgi:serine/threonine protein kinase